MQASHTPDATLVIPSWANGPDGSGNGGWSAGLLAPFVEGAAEGCAVSLRVPPPIGRPLRVAAGEAAGVRLWDDPADGTDPVLVATAEPAPVSLDVPAAVRAISIEAARDAMARFPFHEHHPFPRCVSCGTARAGDEPSLLLHAGPVAGVEVADDAGAAVHVFASTWMPGADVADPDDPALASIAACWSALDCPSAAPFADPHATNPSVLARIDVRLEAPARVGDEHVVAAWATSVDGRKQRSRSVLFDAGGTVLGVADALWIEVRPR